MQICQFICLPRGSADIKIVSISKMSQIDQKGGVSIFKKCLKFKNVPNVGGGGRGVNPNWDIIPNCTVFFLVTPPLKKKCRNITEIYLLKYLIKTPFFSGICHYFSKVGGW